MPEWIDATKLTWLAVGVAIGFDLALAWVLALAVLRRRRVS